MSIIQNGTQIAKKGTGRIWYGFVMKAVYQTCLTLKRLMISSNIEFPRLFHILNESILNKLMIVGLYDINAI